MLVCLEFVTLWTASASNQPRCFFSKFCNTLYVGRRKEDFRSVSLTPGADIVRSHSQNCGLRVWLQLCRFAETRPVALCCVYINSAQLCRAERWKDARSGNLRSREQSPTECRVITMFPEESSRACALLQHRRIVYASHDKGNAFQKENSRDRDVFSVASKAKMTKTIIKELKTSDNVFSRKLLFFFEHCTALKSFLVYKMCVKTHILCISLPFLLHSDSRSFLSRLSLITSWPAANVIILSKREREKEKGPLEGRVRATGKKWTRKRGRSSIFL